MLKFIRSIMCICGGICLTHGVLQAIVWHSNWSYVFTFAGFFLIFVGALAK